MLASSLLRAQCETDPLPRPPLQDLFAPESFDAEDNLAIREDPKSGFYVEGLHVRRRCACGLLAGTLISSYWRVAAVAAAGV